MSSQPTPKPLLLTSAVRIAPQRDPATGRTCCYVQPGESDQVDLFTVTGIHIRTAPAADWAEAVQAAVPPAAAAAQPT